MISTRVLYDQHGDLSHRDLTYPIDAPARSGEQADASASLFPAAADITAIAEITFKEA